MSLPITASILYDLVQCPHRPTMDLFGEPIRRDEINPFVACPIEVARLVS